ncbi:MULTISPECIES: AAA family ATPase [Enterobacter]|jgi:Chromosome segregation ATPases|uniref:AAA family ATPase n=1 Tax=Enterobacter TaxID=547 RepID=UPI001CC5015E|nr:MULTISPECIES: AAA family ATPase [Enterobacter]UAY66758.1 AAA family ATPase [Enterobacter bugandensis]WNZ50733.1 AAA family ATPase [Enterobacter hormaechei subsp. xiangfangensis]
MILKTLSTKNFMPYRGQMSLSFPTDKDRNVMLVFGDNMRGKTSLLNALRWVFYGKAIGRHSREIALIDLVNSEATMEGDWSMEVVVTFEDSGHRYELRRTATKRALVSKPTRSEDLVMERAMRKDDIPLGDHLIDSEINRFAPEQTSRFFLFDGELLDEYEQLLIDGSEQSKMIKEAIEQVLGVPTLIRGRDDAQTILKAAQRQQTMDLQKMGGLESQAEKQRHYQVQIESIEKDIKGQNERLKSVNAEREELDDELTKVEGLYQAKQKLDDSISLRDKATKRQDELQQQRLRLVRDAWKEVLRPLLTLKREHIHDEHLKFTKQMLARAKVENSISQLKEAVKSEICYACGQALHDKERIAAAEELGKLEAELMGFNIDMEFFSTLSTELQSLDKLLKPNDAGQISFIDNEVNRLSVELTKLDNQIDELNELIEGQDTAEIARKRFKRDGLIKESARITGEINMSQEKLTGFQRDLAVISKILENLPKARSAKSSRLVKLASALEKVYSRSIDQLRDDLKATVEMLASEAFRKLTTQSQYSGLRINGNYGLTILDERAREVPIRSAGAEQIVALSLIDGLAHAGRSAGPVVMDTPFGRLDKKHRANILTYLPTTTSQLVLFVHEGEVDKTTDLAELKSRVGCVYEIKEVSLRHSQIERIS